MTILDPKAALPARGDIIASRGANEALLTADMNGCRTALSEPMAEKDDKEESRRILARIERDADTGAGFVMRQSNRLRDHLSAADKDADDPIERWGTMIGRSIAIVALVGFAVWFFAFYARGG
ncbi:MAG: hypothetical protein WBF87_17920 [Mesorhizobium sp.]